MGLFKDINTLKKQAKAADKTWDPGAQARDANARMREMNQSFASATAAMAAPPADSIVAAAHVVSVGMANGMINANPIVPIELMVLQPGLPPRSVAISAVVPMNQMHRLQPGASVPVRLSASDPSAVAIDWSALGS